MYLNALKSGQKPLVSPPLKYQLLDIVKDMNERGLNVSYYEVAYGPSHMLHDYLDMRDIENDIASQKNTDNT